jgi:DNA-binding LacI/PurR family transcriptional regulator
MALGLLSALHQAGVSVPGDISVVGFDDVPEAAYYTPPLTTVRQDFAELGRRGVQLVLARLRHEGFHPEPVMPQLIVRSSTGPVRSAPRRAG